MIVHILNGDSLAAKLRDSNLEGYQVVCREFLMDGPVEASGVYSFWKARAEYATKTYGETPHGYHAKVRQEFEKLERLPKDTEINLWFENDLFCQVNYWFIISQLVRIGLSRAYRVYPLRNNRGNPWQGFGNHQALDLRICLDNREGLGMGDFRLGEHLWNAYRHQNLEVLCMLSKTTSPCFPQLEEVCQAEVERRTQSRPQATLRNILANGHTNFEDIFHRFSEVDGIYGYGDLQVGTMLRGMGADSVQGLKGSVHG
jgi:hypothetical protein